MLVTGSQQRPLLARTQSPLTPIRAVCLVGGSNSAADVVRQPVALGPFLAWRLAMRCGERDNGAVRTGACAPDPMASAAHTTHSLQSTCLDGGGCCSPLDAGQSGRGGLTDCSASLGFSSDHPRIRGRGSRTPIWITPRAHVTCDVCRDTIDEPRRP